MHPVKRLFGLVSLAFEAILIGWFVYDLFSPTHEFKAHTRSVLQLLLPLAMILAGWRWLRDDGPGLESQSIDFPAPERLNAVAEARRNLPRFLEAVRKDKRWLFHDRRLPLPRSQWLPNEPDDAPSTGSTRRRLTPASRGLATLAADARRPASAAAALLISSVVG
mgnify:CR=1 FL=1